MMFDPRPLVRAARRNAVVLCLALMTLACIASAVAVASAGADTTWEAYGGDAGGQRYSTADQIQEFLALFRCGFGGVDGSTLIV